MKKSRLLSLLASAALAVASLGTGLTAFAATAGGVQAETDTHTVTINKTDNGTHVYEAYQLFKGTLTEDASGNKIMTYISWGQNVDTGKLMKLLRGESLTDPEFKAPKIVTDIFDPIADVQSGENLDPGKVADKLGGIENDSVLAQALADVFNAALKGEAEAFKTSDTSGNIKDLTTGYYLFKDQETSQDNLNAAYTDFILRVVDDVEVDSKSDVPTIDKKIKSVKNGEADSGKVGTDEKAGTAAIGDKITYQLDSKVPKMTGYEKPNKYFFIVSDTMCEGLTFNKDVAITINGAAYTKFYVKTKDGEGKNKLDATSQKTFEIVFEDFIDQKPNEGQDIVITYSATLNDKCDRTATGNPNTVDLTFSNNPNHNYSGTPDTPDEPDKDKGDVMGKTPEKTTKVFTTGIRVKKVDENNNQLTGAKFQLTGEKLNKVIVITDEFTEDASGTYYLLKDGTYTVVPPRNETKEQYASTTTKYARGSSASTTVDSSKANIIATVDKNGILVFSGLADGVYTLTEVEAPNGYNLLKDARTITISSDPKTDAEGNQQPNWTVQEDGKEPVPITNDNAILADGYVVETEIQNKKGIILPTTGGIGTVLFYVIGSALIAGAGVLFVTKKRKTVKEK